MSAVAGDSHNAVRGLIFHSSYSEYLDDRPIQSRGNLPRRCLLDIDVSFFVGEMTRPFWKRTLAQQHQEVTLCLLARNWELHFGRRITRGCKLHTTRVQLRVKCRWRQAQCVDWRKERQKRHKIQVPKSQALTNRLSSQQFFPKGLSSLSFVGSVHNNCQQSQMTEN